ncbi:hypothetical protein BLNAU_3617 [Blattamonas nauphoetae]|uniref:Uncharacterized protein n=1 Tax=Blattamonas nauphoetae TaxID=2049346 RepID=A0ABQ9YCL5_9EUKA|nr:hypothetical protein BLNAU_3617 [Blattamonas nauphoetae]
MSERGCFESHATAPCLTREESSCPPPTQPKPSEELQWTGGGLRLLPPTGEEPGTMVRNAPYVAGYYNKEPQ